MLNFEVGSIKLLTLNRNHYVDTQTFEREEVMRTNDTVELPNHSIPTQLMQYQDLLADYESHINNSEFNMRDTQKSLSISSDKWKQM